MVPMEQRVPVETRMVLLKQLARAETHVEQLARPQAEPQAKPQAVRLERLVAQAEQPVPVEAHAQQLAEVQVKPQPTPVV